jgi:hypothetical protein
MRHSDISVRKRSVGFVGLGDSAGRPGPATVEVKRSVLWEYENNDTST